MKRYKREELYHMKNYLNLLAENYFTSTFKNEEEKIKKYSQLLYVSKKMDNIISLLQKDEYSNINI